MINTGPHWEPGRFKPVTGDQMRQAYRSVVRFYALSFY